MPENRHRGVDIGAALPNPFLRSEFRTVAPKKQIYRLPPVSFYRYDTWNRTWLERPGNGEFALRSPSPSIGAAVHCSALI